MGRKRWFIAALLTGCLAHSSPMSQAAVPAAPPGQSANPWKTPGPAYPYAARAEFDQGSGVVQVTTNGQGKISQATMSKSTGSTLLDDNTLEHARAYWSGPPNSTKRIPITYVMPTDLIKSAGPVRVHTPLPPYPSQARANHEEGYGVIRVECDAAGKVVRARMERSTGYDDLDGNVLNFARANWRGPASAIIRVPVDYRLINDEWDANYHKVYPGGWKLPRPHYPASSAKFHDHGSGVVRISTNARGRVTAATMVKSTGTTRLDENTVAYAMGEWDGPPNQTRDVNVTYATE